MPPSSSALASFTVAADEAWLACALSSAGGHRQGPDHPSRGGVAIVVLSFCTFQSDERLIIEIIIIPYFI